MRNTVAKRIKKAVYGEDMSTKNVDYLRDKKTNQIICKDEKRRIYQKAKHLHSRQGVTS